MDTVNTIQKERIDSALAKFIFGCNVPFSVIDSNHFKSFIKEIRPAYKAPCSKTMSTTLLNKLHSEIENNDKMHIGKESVLLIDGWKNSAANTKNVVTMVHTSDGKMSFLESYDFTGLSETGEELATIVQNSIALAKEKYDTEIYCVVSDNAANMVKMGRLITIMFSTCSSHTANLLAKDVINKDISEKAQLVLKEFKHPDIERKLTESGGSKIILAGETRWCSQRDSLKCMIKNLKFMQQVAVNTGHGQAKIKSNIKQILFDDSFIEDVERIIAISDPICRLINQCQSINYSIADAAEDWLNLTLPDEFYDHLEKRRNMALNKFALTANFLHPTYRGKQLLELQRDVVDEFLLDTLSETGLDSLQAFRNGEGIFGTLEKKKVSSPKTFWSLVERKHTELSKISLKLLNIPASSAQLERLFSNWSFIHTDLRNRLGLEKSKKIVHIYYSLKLTDTEENANYTNATD